MTDTTHVLIIEDERDFANLLRDILTGEATRSFTVESVDTLQAGIELAQGQEFGAVVMDLGLPDSKGSVTVASFHAAVPHLPVVVLSAFDDSATISESLQNGAQEYVVKDDSVACVLPRSIHYAIERKHAEQSMTATLRRLKDFESIINRSPAVVFVWDVQPDVWPVRFVSENVEKVLGYTVDDLMSGRVSWIGITHEDDVERLEKEVARCLQEGIKEFSQEYRLIAKSGEIRYMEDRNMALEDASGKLIQIQSIVLDVTQRKRAEEELARSVSRLQNALDGTVNALASTVELRDLYTAGHDRRVAHLACAIAKEIGLSEDRIKGVQVAGALHDIGKIAVPAEILSMPRALTETEFALMKTHPQVGHDILQAIEFPWPVAQTVLEHHERMDGSGYPRGISGEDISLEARLVGVADVVEAMSSHRPYRPALGTDRAMDEISKQRATLYDPRVVDACLKLFHEDGFTLLDH